MAEQPAVFAANVVTFTLIMGLALLKTHPRRPRTARAAERGAQRGHRPPRIRKATGGSRFLEKHRLRRITGLGVLTPG